MTSPFLDDLRERVASLVLGGRSCRETARLLGVIVASALKWSQRQRATGSAAARPMGSAAARPMGGRRRRVLLDERDWILGRLAERPELTVRALADELAVRGITVGQSTVWSFLRASGHSFNKTVFAAEQDRPAAARRRAQW